MSYRAFVVRERKALGFGLSFTFLSGVGQTFLFSLFVPYFLSDFQLSESRFGLLYSTATLVSAFLLPFFGGLIDRVSLKKYGSWVIFGLLLFGLLLASAQHWFILVVGIFGVRLFGQGLSGHTAQTTMARNYITDRGRALSVSSVGFPLGEALFPGMVGFLLTILTWRESYALLLVCLCAFFLIITRWLVESVDSTTDSAESTKATSTFKLWQDRRFWLLLPIYMVGPFWLTAIFLFQPTAGASFGWTVGSIAAAFTGFAAFRFLGSLGVGPLIDRFSAKFLLPIHIIPFIIGLVTIIFFKSTFVMFLYMALLGLTVGMGGNIKYAILAEIFGTASIGQIKSYFAGIMVFSTAASPVLAGYIIQAGWGLEALFIGGLAHAVLGLLPIFWLFSYSKQS